MTCRSFFEGEHKRHLYTVREAGRVIVNSPTCLRCGQPRDARPKAPKAARTPPPVKRRRGKL